MTTPETDTDVTSAGTTREEQLLVSALDRETDISPDTDVILKAEWHFSTGDLREELKLIRTGAFDAVVFEAARENVEEISDPTISDRIIAFPFFFLESLYTDLTPLLVAALTRDADVRFTREADGDVIQDLPNVLHSAILALVFVLGVSIAYFAARAITQPTFAILSFAAFLGIFALPIVIRKARGQVVSGEMNRNEIIARRIETVVDETEGGRVFVPVGAAHAKPVRDCLSDTLNVDIVSPAYGLASVSAMKEFVPGVVKSIVLFVGVWVALAVFGALGVLLAHDIVTIAV